MHYIVKLFLCAALLAPSVLLSRGDAIETAKSAKTDERDAIDVPRLAERFRAHCVRVFIHAQSNQGVSPAVGDFGDDIKHERPTPVGGYWWDETHVVLPDQVLHDRFIRSIEIGLPGSDVRYPARIAGRFVTLQAVLLEVLPNDSGERPEAMPLAFVDGEPDDTCVLSYGWDEGEWRISAKPGASVSTVSDAGKQRVAFSSPGVLVDKDGQALGLGFGKEVVYDADRDAAGYWFGERVHETAFLSAAMEHAVRVDLKDRLSRAVLEARFRIRMNRDDDETEDVSMQWAEDMDDSQLRDGAAEMRSAAFVVGERHLLAPVVLPSEGIALIDGITVILPDGREVAGQFAGALRDYMAILIEVGEDLATVDVPVGFRLLNPLANGNAVRPDAPTPDGMFQRWLVEYSLGRRREVADYDRWLGTFRGYRGDRVVSTLTNEENGSLAFDNQGNLIAVSLTPRLLKSRDPGSGRVVKASPGFRPLAYLAGQLRGKEVFDPALAPVDEEQGQRLIDLGVEFQSLDANTARLFKASHATRGGRIGVLVTHVYPGSIAEELGLRERDVLLRLFVEGRNEPLELRSSGFQFGMSSYDMDMSSDSFRALLRYMPPPWPSRENVISLLLTAAGAGRKVAVDYMRDGEAHRGEFETRYYRPDYRSARKEKFDRLGMTVKPITFEVARYFGREDGSGVIVSRVEDGGKGAVAGVHRYLLVTHVDGRRVSGVEEFGERVRAFENGEAESVELTVDGFGKTRLVKIE